MKKILLVPFKKQSLSYSCFPSAVNMVLRFYGDAIDEKKLYREAIIPGGKGTWDVKIAPFLIKKGYKVTTFWSGKIGEWGYGPKLIRKYRKVYSEALKHGMRHRQDASIDLIKSFIDKGIPSLAEVSADKFYRRKMGVSHILVVVGYSNKYLFIHDPDIEFGGKFKKVSINRFRRAWEKIAPVSGWDISPSAGRSMTVIEPLSRL